MKKVFMLVLAGVICVALSASAQTTTEKVKIKDTQTGATAEKTVTETGEATTTTTKIKGKDVKMEKKEVVSDTGVTGTTQVHIKKGALSNLKIDYNYFQKGTEYILEYNVKDKADKNLMTELGLTPEETKMLTPGQHRVVSTSPYTVGDIKSDFRQIIINDLKTSVRK